MKWQVRAPVLWLPTTFTFAHDRPSHTGELSSAMCAGENPYPTTPPLSASLAQRRSVHATLSCHTTWGSRRRGRQHQQHARRPAAAGAVQGGHGRGWRGHAGAPARRARGLLRARPQRSGLRGRPAAAGPRRPRRCQHGARARGRRRRQGVRRAAGRRSAGARPLTAPRSHSMSPCDPTSSLPGVPEHLAGSERGRTRSGRGGAAVRRRRRAGRRGRAGAQAPAAGGAAGRGPGRGRQRALLGRAVRPVQPPGRGAPGAGGAGRARRPARPAALALGAAGVFPQQGRCTSAAQCLRGVGRGWGADTAAASCASCRMQSHGVL